MRRNRLLFLFLILIVISVVVILLLMQGQGPEPPEVTEDTGAVPITREPPTPTPVPNPVVVAVQNIPRGTRLITDTNNVLADYVRLETNWPVSWVTQEAIKSLDQVKGRIARADIPRGTILLPNMLTDVAGDLGAVGSDAVSGGRWWTSGDGLNFITPETASTGFAAMAWSQNASMAAVSDPAFASVMAMAPHFGSPSVKRLRKRAFCSGVPTASIAKPASPALGVQR